MRAKNLTVLLEVGHKLGSKLSNSLFRERKIVVTQFRVSIKEKQPSYSGVILTERQDVVFDTIFTVKAVRSFTKLFLIKTTYRS